MVDFSLREVFDPKHHMGTCFTTLQYKCYSTYPLRQGLMVSHFCYRMISFHSIDYKQKKTKD